MFSDFKVVPFEGQVIFYTLFKFFILLLERNVFATRWNWKAITISHTTRWSFFSAFPAEGAEAVEMNSLGLWDFKCFYSQLNRKLSFYFYFWWCRTKHPCIHRWLLQQFLFVCHLLMTAMVPVLCFYRVRLYQAVLFLLHALESFQVQAHLLEWHTNIKVVHISALFSFLL